MIHRFVHCNTGHAKRHLNPAMAVGLSLLLALASGRADAPANDNLAAAQVIPPGTAFDISGTDVDATEEAFEHASGYPIHVLGTVWYAWTPTVSGNLQAHISRPGGRTAKIGVFSAPMPGASSFLVQNAGADDIESIYPTAGQKYLFVIGNNDVPGTFEFDGTVTAAAPPPQTLPVATITVRKPEAVQSTGEFGKFLVQLSAPAPANLTLAYTLRGTAVNGTDYQMLSGTAMIPAGQSKIGVKVKPLPGGGDGPLRVKLILQAGPGYTLGPLVKGRVFITD